MYGRQTPKTIAYLCPMKLLATTKTKIPRIIEEEPSVGSTSEAVSQDPSQSQEISSTSRDIETVSYQLDYRGTLPRVDITQETMLRMQQIFNNINFATYDKIGIYIPTDFYIKPMGYSNTRTSIVGMTMMIYVSFLPIPRLTNHNGVIPIDSRFNAFLNSKLKFAVSVLNCRSEVSKFWNKLKSEYGLRNVSKWNPSVSYCHKTLFELV